MVRISTDEFKYSVASVPVNAVLALNRDVSLVASSGNSLDTELLHRVLEFWLTIAN